MFKLVAERRAWWPVAFAGVTEDGEVVENKIEMRFILHSEDEFIGLIEEAVQLDRRVVRMRDRLLASISNPGEPGAAEEHEPLSVQCARFVQKVATDWRGVHAENDDPLKFEEHNIALLMNVPNVFTSIIVALNACRAGKKEQRTGN